MGFAAKDLVVATFGHITWTKWGGRLLEAFLSSSLRHQSRFHLVFAGELPKDHFGRQLEASVRKSGLCKRLRITGYLSQRYFENYLLIAAVVVPLRMSSRGGSPNCVLYSLA